MADANPNVAQPTVEAPAKAEEALMSLLQADVSPEEEKAQADEPQEQPDADVKSETEEPEEAETAEGEPEESEEAAESEEGPERYTVKIDGQERKVTLTELKAGYQKDADYRKKTAEIAEERKSVEKFKSDYEGKLQAATEILSISIQQSHAELLALQKAVDEADVDKDPAGFLSRQQALNKKQREFNERVTNFRRVTAAQNTERDMQFKAYAQDQLKQLVSKYPEYNAAEKRTELAQFAIKQYGFTPDQLKGAADHQFALMAHDAMQFRKMQEKGASKPTPKPTKVMGGKPIARGGNEGEARRSAAYKQVMTSGKGDDLQALFGAIL